MLQPKIPATRSVATAPRPASFQRPGRRVRVGMTSITAISRTSGATSRGTSAQGLNPTSHKAQSSVPRKMAPYSHAPVIRPRASSTPATIMATPATR